jgi:hypothetical protein
MLDTKTSKTPNHPGYKKIFIKYEGIWDISYILYVRTKPTLDVYVYSENLDNTEYMERKGTLNQWHTKITPNYTTLVKRYKPIKIFGTTTVILQLTKNKYVSIGYNVVEFTLKNDTINSFYHPYRGLYKYPCAFGTNYVYFLMDNEPFIKVPIKYFEHLTQKQKKEDAFSYLYGHIGDEALRKYATKMKSVKVIHKRVFPKTIIPKDIKKAWALSERKRIQKEKQSRIARNRRKQAKEKKNTSNSKKP